MRVFAVELTLGGEGFETLAEAHVIGGDRGRELGWVLREGRREDGGRAAVEYRGTSDPGDRVFGEAGRAVIVGSPGGSGSELGVIERPEWLRRNRYYESVETWYFGWDRKDRGAFFLSFKAVGKLTHEDYELITPMIDNALAGVKQPKVWVLFDATELEGWELRAAWDDFKIGLRHGSEFERVAIFGDQKWLEVATKVGSWFIGGEARFFDDGDGALEWLQA